jgi:hypothetical protein
VFLQSINKNYFILSLSSIENMEEHDFALARALQAQFDEEDAHVEVSCFIPEQFRFGSPAKKVGSFVPETSIIAPEWEDLDPTPGMVLVGLSPGIFDHGYRIQSTGPTCGPKGTPDT